MSQVGTYILSSPSPILISDSTVISSPDSTITVSPDLDSKMEYNNTETLKQPFAAIQHDSEMESSVTVQGLEQSHSSGSTRR